MAADLGRWWRTLSNAKLFSKGKPNSSNAVPKSQPVQPVQTAESTVRQDTEQLGPVLKELIVRHEKLLQDQAQRRDTAGVASLSRELLEDAERQAASLRARAIRESEVEAARIVTQAKQQAQEIVSAAQREAQESSQAEVENIIAAARKRAEIAEDQARQAAQLFLLRAREDVHSIVTGEAKEGYYKLLSALQDILAASHAIEKEWRDRSVQLGETAALKWEEYEGALLGSIGHGQLSAPEYSPDVPTTTPKQETREEASQPSQMTSDAAIVSTPDSAAVTAPVEVVEVKVDQEQATSPNGTEVAPPQTGVAPSQVEATAQGPSSVVEAEAIRAGSYAQVELSGEVEILVDPFPEVERLAALYNHLQTVSGLRVLHSTGSWDKGTTVTVILDRPLAIGDMVPLALGAKVSFERGRIGAEDEAGQRVRIALDSPNA